MAIIHIKNLRLKTIIGIHPKERQRKQPIIINLKIQFDSKKAQISDSLNDTLDYDQLVQKIIQEGQKTRFLLLEALASYLLDIILTDKRIQKASIEIDKPKALKSAESVSMKLSRKNHVRPQLIW